MPPPPAEQLVTRIFLGPALRAQPDRRLVKLVREGYEAAFEEIVRRYRKPLDRFAAAIVGGSSEDVTQDAFSKALLALRGSEADIELKPWLYRIVRNTALNDLRDRPAATEELGEAIPGGRSAAAEAERREEMAELMRRLRSLPEPQRAAIVMRELEGLSHEEIATALGVSGGAARQAIYRARAALRDGLGLLVPLPLLRTLFDHGAEAAGAGAGGAVAVAGAASAAGGGGGATLGALGAGGALKVGVATALIAGSLGAGVAMQQDRGGSGGPESASASAGAPSGGGQASPGSGPSGQAPLLGASGVPEGGGRGDGHGSGSGSPGGDNSSTGGNGSSPRGSSGHDGPDPGHGGHFGPGDDPSADHAGEETSGGSHSGRRSSGSSDDGGGGSGVSGGGDDSRGGSSGSSGSGSDGHGGSPDSSEPAPVVSPPPPVETPTDDGGSSGSDGLSPGGVPDSSSPGSGVLNP
jgi:RNA polymerase sigma factor (sigma-70 family)